MDWFEEAEEGLARQEAANKAQRDSFTSSAQKALDGAFDEARRLKHDFIGTEHVLLGLAQLREGVVAKVTGSSGMSLELLRSEMEEHAGAGTPGFVPERLPFTPRMKRILRHARQAATEQGLTRVPAEELLLGLLCERNGLPAKLFKQLDVNVEAVRNQLLTGIKGA